MLRSRISLFLLFASLASTTAWSRPVAEHHGQGPTAESGVYSITFNLNIVSTLPANSTITCKAQIAPAGSMESSFNQQAAVPVESASGVAAVTGATATCLVEIPFSWSVERARNGASLSYEIDAVNASGTLPAVVRTSIQQGVAEAYPSSGGTSSVSFNVTF
jgi:hypothetical protein